ncbi:MAG: (2Fe-2S)-binding protein [Armatimonadota bacterium]|nr:(2Fe-2S)-binding protein [Armatimonadota bacterium]
MVTHCVCFDVSFATLKRLIDEFDIQNLTELRAHVRFGENCGLCLPYVQRILTEGKTAFAVPDDEIESE